MDQCLKISPKNVYLIHFQICLRCSSRWGSAGWRSSPRGSSNGATDATRAGSSRPGKTTAQIGYLLFRKNVTSITVNQYNLISAVCGSFLFDLINAAQGVILFAVLNFDSATIKKIRYILLTESSIYIGSILISFMTTLHRTQLGLEREGEKGE